MKFFESILMRYKYIHVPIVLIISVFVCLCSFAYAKSQKNHLVLDNFSSGKINLWNVREFTGKSDCKVVKENNNYVLRLRSNGTSFLAYKKKNIKLCDYSRLKWSWKVTKLPRGGDVRFKNTDDQAGQVYVRFPILENPIQNKLFGSIWNSVMSNELNMNILGYVWDGKAPVGLEGKNKSWSALRYIVVQSGFKNINKWIGESRNLYNDYKKLFQHVPPQLIEGVGVMINSNNTHSSAETFYDNFILEKK